MTIVKKITGDKDAFLNELRAVLNISPDDDTAMEIEGWRSSSGMPVLGFKRTESCMLLVQCL